MSMLAVLAGSVKAGLRPEGTAPSSPTAGRYATEQLQVSHWSQGDRQRTAAIAWHVSQVISGFIEKNPSGVDTMTGLMLLERDFRDLAMLDCPPGVALAGYWELQDRLIGNARTGRIAYGKGKDAKGRETYLRVRRDAKTLLSVLNKALGTRYAI